MNELWIIRGRRETKDAGGLEEGRNHGRRCSKFSYVDTISHYLLIDLKGESETSSLKWHKLVFED